MKRNFSFRFSLGIVFLGLLAAPRGAAPAEHLKIKLANGSSPPILDSITPYVAVEAGIFKKLGLDVEMAEFRGDNVLTTAMLAGDIQVCSNIGATSAMVSASKGAKLRLWMVPQPVTPYHLIARKDSAPSIKALAGKVFAVSGIGAVSYHIPRMIMERNGLDPEHVKYVVAGSNADRFRAVISRKDAAPSIKALAGKVFAVSGIGAVSYHIPRMIMETAKT